MSTNWRTSGDTSYEAFRDSLPSNSQITLRGETRAVYDAARPIHGSSGACLEAESSGATNYKNVPASFNNPINMRIRGQEPFQQFASIADAATEWKARLTSSTYAYKNTQTVADLVSIYAPSNDNNNEEQYVATVERVIDSLPVLAGADTMALYTVAGLSKKIELPVPLIVDLIPANQTNQRPGYTRETPGYWVQHETANYAAGAGAKMHNDWLHNGAGGAQTSFHFVVDDGVIYQMIPIDEVTWQAADGAGPGNMSGISCELCVNSGINTAQARHNAEALAGGIFKALGLTADRVKRHWDFNAGSGDRHHCPDTMMNDNYWATFVNNVGVIIAKGGGNTTSYAPPITYPWLAGNVPVAVQTINKTKVYPIGNLYTVKQPTPRKQATGNNKQETGPPLKQGETFSARYAYRSGGKTYILTDYGTRVAASDLTPKVQITTSGTVSVRYE
jgi:N-acetylmuramoyl-L-alanine amidase CwlA